MLIVPTVAVSTVSFEGLLQVTFKIHGGGYQSGYYTAKTQEIGHPGEVPYLIPLQRTVTISTGTLASTAKGELLNCLRFVLV